MAESKELLLLLLNSIPGTIEMPLGRFRSKITPLCAQVFLKKTMVFIRLINLPKFLISYKLDILSLISLSFKDLNIFSIVPKVKNSKVFHAGAYLSLMYFL